MTVHVTDQSGNPLSKICIAISTAPSYGATDNNGNCAIDDSLCEVGMTVYAGQHNPGYNAGYVMEDSTWEGGDTYFSLPAVGSVPSNPSGGSWI